MKKEIAVLQDIEAVRNAAQSNQLSLVKTPQVEAALSRLNAYFSTTETQTIILCAAICFCFEENEGVIDYKNLAIFFDVSTMQLLLRSADFERLKELGYLTKPQEWFRTMRFRRSRNESQMAFSVDKNLLQCVLQNQEPDLKKKEAELDAVAFCSEVALLVETRERNERSTDELCDDVFELEGKQKGLKFVEDSKLLLDDICDRIFYYDACKDFLQRGHSSLEDTLTGIFDSAQSLRVAKSMMDGEHPLIANKLLEFERKGSLSDATVTLGSRGREIFLAENAALFEKVQCDENFVNPDDIVEKRLVFDDAFADQLDELRDCLTQENFEKIQERLQQKKMGGGMAILFYGSSGTGKTESAFQLAKSTGRGIYCVDIASTKSAWFGDSEKAVRKIFSKYRSICQSAKKAQKPIPILLFNEADAIFQARATFNSSMSKTENAMQNILLEELEKIQGILIATTNLPQNMDSAFARRFLFKLKFAMPDQNTRVAIWKDKLDWLCYDEAFALAKDYSFSGGLIENVARKAQIYQSLRGSFPDADLLQKYCGQESEPIFCETALFS